MLLSEIGCSLKYLVSEILLIWRNDSKTFPLFEKLLLQDSLDHKALKHKSIVSSPFYIPLCLFTFSIFVYLVFIFSFHPSLFLIFFLFSFYSFFPTFILANLVFPLVRFLPFLPLSSFQTNKLLVKLSH